MATLNVIDVGLDGATPSFTACDVNGDTFSCLGNEMIYIKNGHTSAQKVKLTAQSSCNQGYLHDVEVSVPAGEERMIAMISPNRFGQTVSISYPDGVTSLTIMVVRVRTVA